MLPTAHRSSKLDPRAAVHRGLALILLAALSAATSSQAPDGEGPGYDRGGPLPTIAEKTDGMESIEGFFPLP